MDNITIRAMEPHEIKYAYRQSQQLTMQCGLIGYLQGDYGRNGDEFYTTWFNFNKKLATTEFKDEFDNVVNVFCDIDGGIFSSRTAMSTYCNENSVCSFQDNSRTEYGFRADTENYAYLIRCSPGTADYELNIYPYISDWLDKHIEKAQQGIRFIDSQYNELFTLPDGEKIDITFPNGEIITRTCRYINDTHFETSDIYHCCQFAEIMERNGNTYAPTSDELSAGKQAQNPITNKKMIELGDDAR